MGIDIYWDHSEQWAHYRSLPPSLLNKKVTCVVLLLEFDPVLEDHFELFEDEIVGESVSPGFEFHEVVFPGVSFFHSSVEVDTVPELSWQRRTSSGASRGPYWARKPVSSHDQCSRRKATCKTNICFWKEHCPLFFITIYLNIINPFYIIHFAIQAHFILFNLYFFLLFFNFLLHLFCFFNLIIHLVLNA